MKTKRKGVNIKKSSPWRSPWSERSGWAKWVKALYIVVAVVDWLLLASLISRVVFEILLFVYISLGKFGIFWLH